MDSRIYVIEADHRQRESLVDLLSSMSDVSSFARVDEFLGQFELEDRACCIVAGSANDAKDSPEGRQYLFRRLAEAKVTIPVILLTSPGDTEMAIESIGSGLCLIERPFSCTKLVQFTQAALAADRQHLRARRARREVRRRLSQLTPREHEVMSLMVEGKPTKSIALDLDVSPKTVECHRAKVMRKARAKSLAELVKIWLVDCGELSSQDALEALCNSE